MAGVIGDRHLHLHDARAVMSDVDVDGGGRPVRRVEDHRALGIRRITAQAGSWGPPVDSKRHQNGSTLMTI